MTAASWAALAVSVLALVASVLSVLLARRAALSAERSLRRTLDAAERADLQRRAAAFDRDAIAAMQERARREGRA